MAKNFELIEGGKSNWEIIFFLLWNKMNKKQNPEQKDHLNRHYWKGGLCLQHL